VRFLSDVEYAYNGFCALDLILRRVSQDRFPPWVWPWPYGTRGRLGRAGLVLERDEVASFVPPRQRIRVDAVQLQSPGFWDFLGKSLSVEAISNALNAGKARRESIRREPHQRRMETFEEFDRETEAVLKRHRALREMGVSQEDLAPLINQLVEKPMRELERHQDSGLIDDVEVIDPDDRKTPPPAADE
jgi:hypothetical protein